MICQIRPHIVAASFCRRSLFGIIAAALLLAVFFPVPSISVPSYDSLAKLLSGRGILTFYSSMTALPLEILGDMVTGNRASPVKKDARGTKDDADRSLYAFNYASSLELVRQGCGFLSSSLQPHHGGVFDSGDGSVSPVTRAGPAGRWIFFLLFFIVLRRSALPAGAVFSLLRLYPTRLLQPGFSFLWRPSCQAR